MQSGPIHFPPVDARVTQAKDDTSWDKSLKAPSLQTYRIWSLCLVFFKQEEYCSISLWKEQGRIERSTEMEIFLLKNQTSLEGSGNLHVPMVPTKIFSFISCLTAEELDCRQQNTNFKQKEFILRV